MSEVEIAQPESSTTSNERLLAALAHGSVILSFFGVIVPALLWSFQRRKSNYVAFHALQAAGYQMLMFWVGMAAYLIFFLVVLLLVIIFSNASEGMDLSASSRMMLGVQGSMSAMLFGFIGLYFLLGVVGAALCAMGKDFKYPLLGKRLEKYLERGARPNDPLDETKAEQWMSAMGHASAILMVWGLFTPLALFLVAQKDAPRLRFQSAQAAVYQILATVGLFGIFICYLSVFFGVILSLATNPEFGSSLSPSQGITFIIAMIAFLIIGIIVTLALPTYHLFAMIAGIQVVKGKEYSYPILGRLLAKRLETHLNYSDSEK